MCIALEGDLSEVAYAVGGTSLAGLDFFLCVTQEEDANPS